MPFVAALALYALLLFLGAGPAVALLRPRWRPLWPAIAPVLGLAMIVVGAELPSFFLAATVWGPPLLGALALGSGALLFRHRRALSKGSWTHTAVVVPALLIAVLPLLKEGAFTTLSYDNHDWFYYLVLEQHLYEAGHIAARHVEGDLIDRMGDTLRFGGWRIGISLVGTCLGGTLRALPHQVDGTLWSVVHVLAVPAAHAAHRLIAPRASLEARTFVLLATALSGTTMALLRMTFVSHLASLPLFVLFYACAWRALASPGWSMAVLTALLLAATESVLADATPYLGLLGLTALAERWVSLPHARARMLKRAGVAVVAIAAMPFTAWRIVQSIVSLQYTGYHGPATGYVQPAPSQLLPGLFGLGEPMMRQIRAEPYGLGWVALGTVIVAALFAIHALSRRTAAARTLRAVALSTLALVMGLQSMEHAYPAHKLVLTTSIFVPIVLAVGLDRVSGRWTRRGAGVLAGLLLALQIATGWRWVGAERGRLVGVRAYHVRVAERVSDDPGPVHLVGNIGTPIGSDHDHALSYLFHALGRRLELVPHPASYLRIAQSPAGGWRASDDGAATTIAVRDAQEPGGRVRFVEGPLEVRTVPRPLNRVMDEGVGEAEQEPGRTFHWMDPEATMHLEVPTVGGCIRLEARTLDPSGHATLRFEDLLDEEQPVTYAPITADWQEVVLRPGPNERTLVAVRVEYTGEGVQPAGDPRTLHYAIANVTAQPATECAP